MIGLLTILMVTILSLAACVQANLPALTPAAQPVAGEPAAAESPAAEAAAPAEPAAETVPVACSGTPTSPNMEGPYYTAGSPERASLIDEGMPGMPIRIFGHVFDQNCDPVAGAKVDFWQADANGVYDNAGYTLRGHVLADENGGYAIETIAPGEYPGRPPHIHVKVFAPDGRELLTTQLYLAGSESSADVRAAPDLLVPFAGPDAKGREQVPFDFVVRL
jgi:protocatechuate 3,4-dioxygenase beta subunit